MFLINGFPPIRYSFGETALVTRENVKYLSLTIRYIFVDSNGKCEKSRPKATKNISSSSSCFYFSTVFVCCGSSCCCPLMRNGFSLLVKCCEHIFAITKISANHLFWYVTLKSIHVRFPLKFSFFFLYNIRKFLKICRSTDVHNVILTWLITFFFILTIRSESLCLVSVFLSCFLFIALISDCSHTKLASHKNQTFWTKDRRINRLCLSVTSIVSFSVLAYQS